MISEERRRARFASQQDRLTTGLLYAIGLLVLSQAIHGQWIPPFDEEGLWYYGGFLPLLLARILEPWFPRPADAFANGVTLIVASAAVTPTNPDIPDPVVEAARVGLALYGAAVIAVAAVAMMWRTAPGFPGVAAERAASIARAVGQARVVFSWFLGFAVLVGQWSSPQTIGLMAAAWVIVVFVQPLEAALAQLRKRQPALPSDGLALEHEMDPRILVTRAKSGDVANLGSVVTWESGGKGVVVDRTELTDHPQLLVSSVAGSVRPSGVLRVEPVTAGSIVGYVAESTSIGSLVVRATADASRGSAVTEGRLVAAPIRGKQVLFQVTSAAISERVEWGARRNTLEIAARKLGTWDDEEKGFSLVPWVADAGTAVSLVEDAPTGSGPQLTGVGRVPGTSYDIGVRIDSAVLFNTAILGILGVGKTSLAWELIQRMLCDEIRVIVIDITGEYALRFRAQFPEAAEKAIYDLLEGYLAPNRPNAGLPRERAGNWNDVRPAIRNLLEKAAASNSRLLILNPSQLDVTAEDGFPQGGVVPLRRLTNVEVVRLIAEEVLDFARTTTPADPREKLLPRLCLVLEEAHSLVPEGGSTADRNEQTATAGTARAVLQGRKYGLGCLLITQRTANVTKTILNQCHTVFAMRSFDATSESFLANYLGREYSALLPSLRDRQAVLFGRASTSQAPVLIELNDRDRFTAEVWDNCAPSVPVTDIDRAAQAPTVQGPAMDEQYEEEFEPGPEDYEPHTGWEPEDGDF